MKLSLAFSSCPNDTFIFDALVNNRIDAEGFDFGTQIVDIQELNEMALRGSVDIIKLSLAAYPNVSQNYQLLTSGGAMGSGVGPLVVSRLKIYPDEVGHTSVAIPGLQTTANLLFTLKYPNVIKKKVYLFSQIEEALLSYQADIGVLIHEGRFTYQKKGLRLVLDLGVFWEQLTGFPIPLGGIAVRRSLPEGVKQALNRLIRASTEYAITRPSASYPFVRQHAHSIDDDALRGHIELYVNDYTLNFGAKGKEAANELFKCASGIGFCGAMDAALPAFISE